MVEGELLEKRSFDHQASLIANRRKENHNTIPVGSCTVDGTFQTLKRTVLQLHPIAGIEGFYVYKSAFSDLRLNGLDNEIVDRAWLQSEGDHSTNTSCVVDLVK